MQGLRAWGLLTTGQRATLLAVVAISLALATVAGVVARNEEHVRTQRSLRVQGESFARQLEHELDTHGLFLTSAQSFFTASEWVTQEELQRFAHPMLEKNRGIQLLAWVPAVPSGELKAWQARLAAREKADGPGQLVVRPLHGPLGTSPAASRTLHPILHIEPEALRPVRGADLGSIDALRRAFDRARDHGAVEVIPRPPELGFPPISPSHLAVQPVYRALTTPSTPKGRQATLLGHLLAGADPARMLAGMLRRYPTRGLDLFLFQDPGGKLLALHRERPEAGGVQEPPTLATLRHRPHYVQRLHAAGHHWLLAVAPAAPPGAALHSPLPWLVFGGVLGLGLLVTLFAGSILTAAARARRDASDLARSKAALEREMKERALAEEARAHLATAIEHAEECFIVTDLQGLIQYVNPAFERVSGYTRKEVLGESIMLLSSGRKGGAFHGEVFETLERGEVWTGRFQNRRKDGTVYQDEASISPVRDATGRIVAYVSVQRDITEQLRLESRLRQIHKMEAMGTLAGGIAHDFNNILTAVLGHAELALMDTPPDSPVHGSLLEITRAGRRASDLVAQILTFSRKSEEERRPLLLQPVITEALRLLRGSLPPTVEIQRHLDPDCPPVVAEPGEIHQVMLNLGSNAFHAMRERGGILTVSLRAEQDPGADPAREGPLKGGRRVCLTVSDTGHGIDAATRERIFEPYFTTKDRGEGSGLGLSTVHGIVRRMGGTIEVTTSPGQGTTFTIRVPAVSGETSMAKVEQAPPPEVAGTEHILLVDDEEQIAAYLAEALGRLGYRVTPCKDGIEALEKLQAAPEAFDVVVTDQMMPRMQGTALARAARALRPDLPIVLCSGFGDAMADLPTGDRVITEVVPKPLSAATLAQVIRRILATPGSGALRDEAPQGLAPGRDGASQGGAP